jgi:hypothetical protein
MQEFGAIRSAELVNDQAWVELLKSYRIVDAVVKTDALSEAGEVSDQPVRRLRPG